MTNPPSSSAGSFTHDGSHNHPSKSSPTSTSIQSHPDHSTLRDGSHNHPVPNTLDLINSRLRENGLTLPPPGGPKANYQLLHRDGNTLYLSGHLPIKADGTMIVGCCAPPSVIGGAAEEENTTTTTTTTKNKKYLTTQEGYEAAKHCALNLLSTLQSYLSEHVTVEVEGGGRRQRQPADLSHVVKVMKLFGIVRSHDDFTEQHLVMNGASDVLGLVLGKEVGAVHARSAIGTNSLPLGIAVEVEMIVKIKD